MNDAALAREIRIAADLIFPPQFALDIELIASGVRTAAEEEAEERVKKSLLGCFKAGLRSSVGDIIKQVRELKGQKLNTGQISRKVFGMVKDKLNLRKTAKEIWKIALTKGWKMAVVAVLLEIFEDIVLPGIAIAAGFPELAPVFLALHFEPFVYPIAFCLL
jgi:hypothetical protein